MTPEAGRGSRRTGRGSMTPEAGRGSRRTDKRSMTPEAGRGSRRTGKRVDGTSASTWASTFLACSWANTARVSSPRFGLSPATKGTEYGYRGLIAPNPLARDALRRGLKRRASHKAPRGHHWPKQVL